MKIKTNPKILPSSQELKSIINISNLSFSYSLYYNRQHYHVLCHKENHPLTGSLLMPDLTFPVSLI